MEDRDVECRQTGLVFSDGDFGECFRELVERYRVMICDFVVMGVQRYPTSEGVESGVLKFGLGMNFLLEAREYQEWAMFGIEVFRMKDFVYKIRDEVRFSPSNAGRNECCRFWRWLGSGLNFRLWRATPAFLRPVPI